MKEKEEYQRDFTQASRIYLALEEEIRELFKFGSSNVSLDETLKSFDLLVQILLLNLSVLDGKITKEELKFVHKISIEEDIIDYINLQTKKNITWEDLSLSTWSYESFSDFLDYISNIVSIKINSFILVVASKDAITKKNYAYKFYQGLKELACIFVDANNDRNHEREIDQILQKNFIVKYKALKSIFSIKSE